MSNSTRRLDRVGRVVTPTQLFLLWMEEVQQFHSLRDYVLSLKGKPDGAYPLVRLPAQMDAAVRQEMKGQAQDAIQRAADRGERDVIFLFHLFMNANKNVLEERRANWLHVLLLTATLHEGPDGAAPTIGRTPWAEAMRAFLLEVYATTGAVECIAKRYFVGKSPLFPQMVEDLQELVKFTEQVVELYNEGLCDLGRDGALRTRPALGEPIDCSDVKKRSVARATATVEQTVRLSKAETLVVRGDRRGAAELIQQHL